MPFPPAPTAAIDSGQMSRRSNTQGLRLQALSARPLQVVKNCGEVATITSHSRRSPAQKLDQAKLR